MARSEGVARNCSFEVEGGPVFSINVFWFGAASGFEGTRNGYADNRGGVTDISGIGEEAFYPNGAGPNEIVAHAGGKIFAITVFTGLTEPSDGTSDLVADLAKAIAANLD